MDKIQEMENLLGSYKDDKQQGKKKNNKSLIHLHQPINDLYDI